MRVIKYFIVWMVIIASIWMLMAIVLTHLLYGVASKETEAKYLRNIEKFYPVNDGFVYAKGGGDSLGFMATTAHAAFDPLHKWHIEDVGLINKRSELSKKLDSMITRYVDSLEAQKNKLK